MNQHQGKIIWFTGLSGAGKSTLANALEQELRVYQARTCMLDGDRIRQGLCSDLGFSDADRTENIRRIGEVSRLMMDAGLIVIAAFISPFRRDRRIIRSLVKEGDFIEIFCDAPLSLCEARDVKGLYKKARANEIAEFTGVTSAYQRPENPELILKSGELTVDACINIVITYLTERKYLQPVPLQETMAR